MRGAKTKSGRMFTLYGARLNMEIMVLNRSSGMKGSSSSRLTITVCSGCPVRLMKLSWSSGVSPGFKRENPPTGTSSVRNSFRVESKIGSSLFTKDNPLVLIETTIFSAFLAAGQKAQLSR